ncbi:histidine phosphatase family protein [Arenibaculum sp.]|uniref:SixA phosphatase family protein n=1 Tax=Arenibaculum sp. TaxID=2865862 RepID=UPI002E0E4571|nr:histidine phosphatase family protein [Arenibaculum sp.]
MKTLHLLRHAKSSRDDPDLPDHDRPLADRGREAAAWVGRHMAGRGLAPGLVLCSTARRAEDTLALALSAAGAGWPVERERGLYLAGAPALLDRLRRIPDEVGSVLLVGHNPDLHDLARDLASSGDGEALAGLRQGFPTATLAGIEFDVPSWRELAAGSGRLVGYTVPRKT